MLCMSGHAKCIPEARHILLSVTRSLPCHVIVRLTIVQKVAVRAVNAFNLNCLRSRSLSSPSHLAEVYVVVDIVKY